MAWENLPTDYTDAAFIGLRKYSEVDNGDGTISFIDMTSYTNKENSFFGANDANKMNAAINEIIGTLQNAPSYRLSQLVFSSSAWEQNGDYYTQVVSNPDIKANERVDLQPDADDLLQLMTDGVGALYVENENGVLTAYSIGSNPTVDLTMQVTLVGLPFGE